MNLVFAPIVYIIEIISPKHTLNISLFKVTTKKVEQSGSPVQNEDHIALNRVTFRRRSVCIVVRRNHMKLLSNMISSGIVFRLIDFTNWMELILRNMMYS